MIDGFIESSDMGREIETVKQMEAISKASIEAHAVEVVHILLMGAFADPVELACALRDTVLGCAAARVQFDGASPQLSARLGRHPCSYK